LASFHKLAKDELPRHIARNYFVTNKVPNASMPCIVPAYTGLTKAK
jgi:hypothetical protein